jgi:hypothetical protein
VDLYIHSPLRLHGVVLNYAQKMTKKKMLFSSSGVSRIRFPSMSEGN